MTRCPQKQGFPGVPVGAQTLTRPFRLFSRVCSCPVAPRAGPGSHPPPPGPGEPASQPQPSCPPPHPSLLEPAPAHLHLCCRCLSVCQGPARPPGPCGPSGLPGTALVPPLGLGLETGIWGKGERGQRSTRQWTASKDNTKNFTLDAIFPPVSSQNVGILLLSFMGRKYKILVLNVVSEMWGQMPAYVSPQCVQSQVGR